MIRQTTGTRGIDNAPKSLILQIILIVIVSFLLGACGAGNSELAPVANTQDTQEEPAVTDEETSFSGRVVKGVITNAIIEAYPILNQNGVYVIDYSGGPIVVRSDNKGFYQIRTGQKKNDSYYYLKVVTDDQTRMVCDIHTGCVSKLTGDYVGFGETYTLSSGFVLSNIVKSMRGKINQAPIGPLTHLAVKYMETLPEGFSPANIGLAEQFIRETFGLGSKTLRLVPYDLTKLTEIKRLNEEKLRLGVMSAAFAPFIESANWDDISGLPLAEIFQLANNLVQYLSGAAQSAQHVKTLAVIETDTAVLYESAAQQALTITEQPGSEGVSEGDTVMLRVLAFGSESINYQWLKGSVEIAGAT